MPLQATLAEDETNALQSVLEDFDEEDASILKVEIVSVDELEDFTNNTYTVQVMTDEQTGTEPVIPNDEWEPLTVFVLFGFIGSFWFDWIFVKIRLSDGFYNRLDKNLGDSDWVRLGGIIRIPLPELDNDT